MSANELIEQVLNGESVASVLDSVEAGNEELEFEDSSDEVIEEGLFNSPVSGKMKKLLTQLSKIVSKPRTPELAKEYKEIIKKVKVEFKSQNLDMVIRRSEFFDKNVPKWGSSPKAKKLPKLGGSRMVGAWKKQVDSMWTEVFGKPANKYYSIDDRASGYYEFEKSFLKAAGTGKRVKSPKGFDMFWKKPFKVHRSVESGFGSFIFDAADKAKVVAWYEANAFPS